MESIDDLLSQIKAEYEEKDNPNPPPKQPTLKAEDIFLESSTSTPPPQSSWQKSVTSAPSAAEYNLLSEVKAEFAQKEREEELKRQEKIREEQRRQEQIKQQQRKALAKEAEVWLKKLNPRSEEGLWFEEFAYSYSSKLEAAIDYLQALKETKAKP